MFIKKVAVSLALVSSLISNVHAQEANDCAKLAFAQVKAQSQVVELQNEISKLEEAHSAFVTIAKGAAVATVSATAAAIVRTYFSTKQKNQLMEKFITTTDTPAFKEQIKKIDARTLMIVGAAGVVGSVIVTINDAKIYSEKIAQLGQEKVLLLQKVESVKQMLIKEKAKFNCN